MTVFGERLKELRTEKKMSQKQLSIVLNYSQSVICDWENSKVEPTATAIVTVAEYFNVSTDFLLGQKDFLYQNNIKATWNNSKSLFIATYRRVSPRCNQLIPNKSWTE